MRRTAWAVAAVLGLAGPGPSPAAAGDGTWTQIDGWAGGVQWVTNVERGRWMLATSAGIEDDEAWGRIALMHRWSVGPESAPWNLRAGVALRAEQVQWYEADDYPGTQCWSAAGGTCVSFAGGVRLSVDRWKEYGRWGSFLMFEWTSSDNETLAVAGLTHLPSGLGAQLSLWHEDGGKLVPTVMVTKSVTRRLSVRVGHKFVEDETFVGLSLSTY